MTDTKHHAALTFGTAELLVQFHQLSSNTSLGMDTYASYA